MRASLDVCGCFPTGRHYPGIADRISRTTYDTTGLCADVDAAAAWAHARLAVIDFETTGLSTENDRILEIGIACFSGGELTLLKDWLVNPGMPIPEQSSAVHGIKDADVASAPAFAQVLTEISELLRGHLPVAYNAPFDRGFLHAELARAGISTRDEALPPAFASHVVWLDPLVWARELYRDDKGKKLTEMCARLGIALDNAHRAASDSEAAGRVLLAMADRMPVTYAEVIGVQGQYAARQEIDFARRRGGKG